MRRGIRILLLPTAATSCLLALAIGNFGTVVRERMQVVVLLIPFLAVGLAARIHGHPEEEEASATPAAAG